MWDLQWVSVYQDFDRKEKKDVAFRAEEAVVCQDLRGELIGGVANLAGDPRAGWALCLYLKWYTSKILHKFDILQSGTKFHWGFMPHVLQASWLFIGALIVPIRINEWGAVARLIPTHIRAIGIYIALFSCWALTNELLMRTTEDQLLSLWIPTTSYLIVNEMPKWRYLQNEQWFVWTIVGATSVFVFIVSLRRIFFNALLKLFFRWKRYDPAFIAEITRVHQRLSFPSNKVLNLIDRHQFVATYWAMIWEPSKLSVNLSIRNSFLKEDIDDLLGGLKCRATRTVVVGATASRWTVVKRWLSGGQYPRGPKLFMAFLALLILAFAIGPFFDFPFVIASAVPWGLRCILRIGAPAISPNQSTGDVAKIFAVVVATGLTDFPFSIALVSTDFKIFDSVVARWLLTALVAVLVGTISDAIAPFMLFLCEKLGWADPPKLRPRLEEDPAAAIEKLG
ncbi:hypothetical protein ACCS93_35735 [Rhizobium ruizarguesonis]